jgi:hypothetical protein
MIGFTIKQWSHIIFIYLLFINYIHIYIYIIDYFIYFNLYHVDMCHYLS